MVSHGEIYRLRGDYSNLDVGTAYDLLTKPHLKDNIKCSELKAVQNGLYLCAWNYATTISDGEVWKSPSIHCSPTNNPVLHITKFTSDNFVKKLIILLSDIENPTSDVLIHYKNKKVFSGMADADDGQMPFSYNRKLQNSKCKKLNSSESSGSDDSFKDQYYAVDEKSLLPSMGNVFENKVLLTSINPLQSIQYRQILETVRIEDCCTSPPVQPKPGDVILYYNKNAPLDWKSDQFRWREYGRKQIPNTSPYLKCIYFASSVVGNKFTKKAYTLIRDGALAPTTLIHYFGSTDDVIETPHGNTKGNEKKNITPHVMTAKSQLMSQKDNINFSPKQLYRKQVTTFDGRPAQEPVMAPRNYKQCANTIALERQKKMLSSDDIFGLYLLNEEVPNFIKSFQLLPNFIVVLLTKTMSEFFTRVSHLPELVLHYDTTFNIGDFYLSILVFKHPVFKSKPIIPLAYVMHHTKKYEVHKIFFETIVSQCSALGHVGLKIITDREAAISKAIKTVLPNVKIFYCWNHLQRDVGYWLKKKRNSDKSDSIVYNNNIWDLLDSDSEAEFHNKLQQMSSVWSTQFLNYFNKNLKLDIISSGKWVLQQPEVNIYEERSGITNNPSESFNAVLKRIFTSEVKAQICAISIYQLYMYYEKEITRGLSRLGDYKLNDKYCDEFYIPPKECLYQKQHINLDKVPYCFTNLDIKPSLTEEEREYSVFSLAKLIVLQNRIRHMPELQCFAVRGETNDYIVRLFAHKDDTCTCTLKRKCHHIKAVRLSINYTQIEQDRAKVHTLVRKSRGFTTGRKKVPKNVTIVEAADDSELFQINKGANDTSTQSFLIPTITNNNEFVKRRFVQKLQDHDTPGKGTSKIIHTSTPKHLDFKKEIDDLHNCSIIGYTDESENQNIDNGQNIVYEINVNSLSVNDDNLDNNDFETNYNNNVNFYVCGREINKSILKPLENIQHHMDYKLLYQYGSTICVYLTILCKEEEENDKNVKYYTCDDIILSNYETNEKSMLQTGLLEFLTFRVPEYDIIIFPVCKEGHCYTIVILTKPKIVLFLDSLLRVVKREDIKFALKVMKLYYKFNGKSFDEKQFTIYGPKVFQQFNGYDCGLYACLFGETIIKRTNSHHFYHLNKNFAEYKMIIKHKIIENMKSDTKPLKMYAVDEAKFKLFPLKCSVNISSQLTCTSIPNNADPMEYLKNISDNYWKENSFCDKYECLDKYNHNTAGWVHCTPGNHWFHLECAGVVNQDITKNSYICQNCRLQDSSYKIMIRSESSEK